MTTYQGAVRSFRPPDLVIAARVVLAFVAIGLFSLPHPLSAAAPVLTIVVLWMDAFDGFLARRLGMTSDLGAVLDITGDRIVEHVFWIYFAVAHAVPMWVPLVVVTRSFVVDTVRGMALARGKTAFGRKTMMRSRLSRFLVASRFMRDAYGGAKVVAFVMLGAVVALEGAMAAGAHPLPNSVLEWGRTATRLVVLVTVGLNVLRGVPVVWDARPYLRHELLSG